MNAEPDYLTIIPTVSHLKFNVVVMRWDHVEQNYVVSRCSQALNKLSAEALAQSWAAAGRLERR